jgi:DNA-binding NarL/FixJ family response regulator
MQMLQHVANGYILKNASAQEIVICINEAMEGYVELSKEVKEIMYKPTLDDLKPIPVLTKREKDILKRIADGQTTNLMAEELFLSPHTIKSYRRNLLQKFKTNNGMEMIKVAIKYQII